MDSRNTSKFGGIEQLSINRQLAKTFLFLLLQILANIKYLLDIV